ncbi:MAG: hypothetical protein ACOCP8_07405 [archaeon]
MKRLIKKSTPRMPNYTIEFIEAPTGDGLVILYDDRKNAIGYLQYIPNNENKELNVNLLQIDNEYKRDEKTMDLIFENFANIYNEKYNDWNINLIELNGSKLSQNFEELINMNSMSPVDEWGQNIAMNHINKMKKQAGHTEEYLEIEDEIFNVNVILTTKEGKKFYNNYHNWEFALERVTDDVLTLQNTQDEIVEAIIKTDNI